MHVHLRLSLSRGLTKPIDRKGKKGIIFSNMPAQAELGVTTGEQTATSPLRSWWAALPPDRQRELWLGMSHYDLREIAPDLPPLQGRDTTYLDSLTAKAIINVERTEAWINGCRSGLPPSHKRTFGPVVDRLRDFAYGAFRLDMVDRLFLACDPRERKYLLGIVVNREPPEMPSDAGHNILNELMRLARKKGRSTSTIHPRIVLKAATEDFADEDVAKRVFGPGVVYLGSSNRVPTVGIIKTERDLQRAFRGSAGEQT